MCDIKTPTWQEEAGKFFSDSVVWGIETEAAWDKIKNLMTFLMYEPLDALAVVIGDEWREHEKRWGFRIGDKKVFTGCKDDDFPPTLRVRVPARRAKIGDVFMATDTVTERLELWERRRAWARERWILYVEYERVA